MLVMIFVLTFIVILTMLFKTRHPVRNILILTGSFIVTGILISYIGTLLKIESLFVDGALISVSVISAPILIFGRVLLGR